MKILHPILFRSWRRLAPDSELQWLKAEVASLQAANERLGQRCLSLEARLALVDELPVPPAALRVRVGQWPDPDHFLGVGRKLLWDVKRLLSLVHRELDDFRRVLDFGCGCGRVLRHFRPPAAGGVLHGTDIDAESIEWCRAHLGSFATFERNGDRPPLRYPDEFFDLVYAISVFSHLPQDLQSAWLAEIRRVLRPGGLFIGSVHGEALLLAAEQAPAREALRRQGILYIPGGGTPGLPDYYQTTYHTREYLEGEWGRHFEILHFQERGINNQQDAVVCGRPRAESEASPHTTG